MRNDWRRELARLRTFARLLCWSLALSLPGWLLYGRWRIHTDADIKAWADWISQAIEAEA